MKDQIQNQRFLLEVFYGIVFIDSFLLEGEGGIGNFFIEIFLLERGRVRMKSLLLKVFIVKLFIGMGKGEEEKFVIESCYWKVFYLKGKG